LGNNPQVITASPEKPKPKWEGLPRTEIGRLALVAGIFIVLVGWVDILVGWFPSNFGSPEWEFGAVSATVDGLPLSTVGVALALLGASASGSRVGLWTVAAWAGWVILLLLVAAGLYSLTVPVALGALGPAGLRAPLGRAVIKTSTLLLLYLVFYVWMEWNALRCLKRGT
jgi:hypothetical protein